MTPLHALRTVLKTKDPEFLKTLTSHPVENYLEGESLIYEYFLDCKG